MKLIRVPEADFEEESDFLPEELGNNESDDITVDDLESGEQMDGKTGSDEKKEGLPHQVLPVDKTDIDEGAVVAEAFDHNIGSFVPEMMFEQMVKNYKNAEKLYGKTIVRELGGYDPKYIDKNAKIPEFQRELKKQLQRNIDKLKEKGLIRESGKITLKGLESAALFLIEEEFDKSRDGGYGFGEQIHMVSNQSGEKTDARKYIKGDRFKDIAVKYTITKALRRGHTAIEHDDIQIFDREAEQHINVVYALDASGSMRGEKLRLAKKAGVSLAHKALRDRNDVGLVVFGSNVEKKVPLTKDFYTFVKPLTMITPGQETDIALAIKESIHILEKGKGIKHIVLLTDGIHTVSDDPQKAILEQIGRAAQCGITISVAAMIPDEEGLQVVRMIVNNSKGKLYAVKDLDDMQGILIADYESLQ